MVLRIEEAIEHTCLALTEAGVAVERVRATTLVILDLRNWVKESIDGASPRLGKSL